MAAFPRNALLIAVLALVLFASHAHAFGAGNIASISAVEGRNWRHGDIEDLLKQVACIRHHKWNTMMIKRVYFGNWLRDYSQAMDVGALKKANAETIRILVWLLSFLGFGYATAEFEVTSERLGVYRPEEHIDNPKNYNDDQDARVYEPRLRAPIRPIELEIDPDTGMKNYIANVRGDWATSAAFVKYSFERSIQHGRQYCSGTGFMSKGKEEDLAEALRLLGQGLHTLEDFGAHTNYCELSLIELGHRNVFPLVGTQTGINLRGKHVFPLVTGTFGMVDFYHSVLGEATDHFTQSEINEMDNALGIAQSSAQSSSPLTTLIKLLAKVPGTRDLCAEAQALQANSQAQARVNSSRGFEGGSSNRGFDDNYNQGTRAGPGDHNGSQQGYSSYGQQSGYQQNHQQAHDYQQGYHQSQGYNQEPQQPWGQPGHDYPQPGGWQSSHDQSSYQQSSQQWGQNQNQNQNHQQSYSSPPQYQHQSYEHSSQPQWNQSQSTQSYSQQSLPHELPAGQPQVQSHSTPDVLNSSGSAQTAAAQPAGLPGMPNFDPAKTIQQIYPILAFRDKVVRTISEIIEKIPGLEALVDKIVETLTVFVLSLLAPFIRPLLEAISKNLQKGSGEVIDSSAKHQLEIWNDPRCSDPTHSMLSKDHFSNVLNEPAGLVAGEILKYIAPRVLYAWEHPEVPIEKVKADIDGIFHHPAIRDERNEVHRNMFNAVKKWRDGLSDRGRVLDDILSIDAVKNGRNHKGGVNEHLASGSSMHHPPAHNQSALGGMYQQYQGLASMTGIGGHHGSSSQHQSFVNEIGNMMGGGQHNNNHQSQSGMGGVFNQASNLYNTFSGHGSHSGSGGGGGLGDMLSMANKLPIPGVSNLASSFSKLSGFGTRGIDESGPGSRSMSSDNDNDNRSRSYESGPGGNDIAVDPSYAVFGGSNIGGARELRDAMCRANGRDRSPSPPPLSAPAGYEEYGSTGSGRGYDNDEGARYSQHQGYGGGYGSGESGGYYRQ